MCCRVYIGSYLAIPCSLAFWATYILFRAAGEAEKTTSIYQI